MQVDFGSRDEVPFVPAAVVREGVRAAEAVSAHVQGDAGLWVRGPGRRGREGDCDVAVGEDWGAEFGRGGWR